jgi:hypothetical protein
MSVELPATTTPSQIGWSRVCVLVGRMAADKPWYPCLDPHLFNMALAMGAHQPDVVGRPQLECETRSCSTLGRG